jgi:competence protein ComEA
VDQSSPPWRVFDAPGSGPDRLAAGPARGGAAADEAAPARWPATSATALVAIAGAVGIGVLAAIVAITGNQGSIIGPTAADASGDPSATIVVDVAGAVARPGVYRLPSGSRVGDAIGAAGGFSPRVAAQRVDAGLNLAALLRDGERIVVPSRDDPTPGTAAAPGGDSGGLIDLNSATQAELESLPGIGPVTAGKIIASRDEAPFAAVDDLRARGLVGPSTFEQIRALVTAG